MAQGMSMRGAPRLALCAARAAAAILLAALLWPPAAGADDWATGNYRDRHYENDLHGAGVAIDTASLIKAVQGDSRVEVRRWAAIVLGRRQEHTARETLEAVAQLDGSAEVRTEALLALARLGDASVLPALEQVMRDGQPRGGPAVLAAELAELGDVAGYEYVEREVAAASPLRRGLSVFMLREFLPYRGKGLLPDDPFQVLVGLTHDSDRSVRDDAVTGLELAWWKGVSVEEIRKAMRWMIEQKEDSELRELAKRELATVEFDQENVDKGLIKRPHGG